MMHSQSRVSVPSMSADAALTVVLKGIFGLSTTGPRRTLLRTVARGGAALTILLVILQGNGTLLGGRAGSIPGLTLDPNALVRLDFAKDAVAVFVTNPVGGARLGSFATLDPLAMYPHNAALEVPPEIGIEGLGIWVG